MDPKSHNTESVPFNLPEVQPDPNEVASGFESGASHTDEKAMSQAIEQNVTANPLGSLGATATNPLPTNVPGLDTPSNLMKSVSGAKKIVVTDDLPANDSDLIEKAWVAKAKAIVEQTKNNPYEQTNEFKKIRADYQNKRFNSNPKIDRE